MIIEEFENEYDEIIKKREEDKDVSGEIKEYVIKVLRKIIDKWEGMDVSSREKVSEEAGEIPIKLFGMDDFEIKKELEKIIFELADIENSKVMKNIDRFSLIKKVYGELKNV